MQVGVCSNVECATANQASQSQADSQSGHGTSGSQESPELHAEDISEEIMNFSLQEISASFSLCINCFFLSLLEKYVCLVIVFHFMPKKCFLSLSAPDLSVIFCLCPFPPGHCFTSVMGKEPEQEFLCLQVLFG